MPKPVRSPAAMSPTHSFDHPPVIETVLGAQFKPVNGFTNGHLGAFWKKFASDWPHTKDAGALVPQYERFEPENSWTNLAGVALNFSDVPVARLQIRNRDQDRMIQVQNARFHYNWTQSKDQYPRYTNVRKEFLGRLNEFIGFVKSEGLGDIDFDQWEVTYVNHIPAGSVWKTPKDWSKLFRGLRLVDFEENARPENMFIQVAYRLPENRGRLHLKLQHALFATKSDSAAQEVLRFELTARGPITSQESLEVGLDLGHDAIIQKFVMCTSDDAHKYWGYHGNR
jgi:uncharacterized protein (TIGR04255 family)